MKIFGIGLNKTGTTTLGWFFKEMKFKHLSCRRDLLIKYRKGNLEEIFDVIDCFETFEDWPYPLMYRELFDRYGDSKFILTTRISENAWLKSLSNYSFYTDPFKHCRYHAYGYHYPKGFEDEHLEFYRYHNDSVRSFFKKNNAEHRLLEICWEKDDDVRKLINFIGCDKTVGKIPHLNKAQGKKYTRRYMLNSVMSEYFKITKIFVK